MPSQKLRPVQKSAPVLLLTYCNLDLILYGEFVVVVFSTINGGYI